MADIAGVSRELNRVKSVGQARAAINAGQAEIDTGMDLSDGLSWLSVPTESQARATLAVVFNALSAEMRLLDPYDGADAVPGDMWTRQRRQVERAYNEVAGIAGVVGALDRVSLVDELGQAISEAPALIGAVTGGVGDLIGTPVAAFLKALFANLWFWIILAAVVLFVVYLGLPKLKLMWGIA